jgi:hypothetical protein
MYPRLGGGRWTNDPRKAAGAGRILPCGRCQACRKRITSDWTNRLIREAQYHPQRALMITLTLEDKHLPADFSVNKKFAQKTLKRIRKRFGKDKRGNRLRYYLVAEYGSREDKTKRPHYHILVFGIELTDLCDPDKTQSNFIQYRSPSVESCWTDPKTGELRGRVRVSFADAATMSYVAGYVHKKLGGLRAKVEYSRVHPVTGEIVEVEPEFALMSRRPGIGKKWFDEFADTDAQSDFLINRGRPSAMPRYYARLRDEAAKMSDAQQAVAKLARRAKAEARSKKQAADLTPERLAVREEVHDLRTQGLARGRVR